MQKTSRPFPTSNLTLSPPPLGLSDAKPSGKRGTSGTRSGVWVGWHKTVRRDFDEKRDRETPSLSSGQTWIVDKKSGRRISSRPSLSVVLTPQVTGRVGVLVRGRTRPHTEEGGVDTHRCRHTTDGCPRSARTWRVCYTLQLLTFQSGKESGRVECGRIHRSPPNLDVVKRRYDGKPPDFCGFHSKTVILILFMNQKVR